MEKVKNEEKAICDTKQKNLNSSSAYKRLKENIVKLIEKDEFYTGNLSYSPHSEVGESYTISINAPWGTGKTFFLHDLKEELEKNAEVKMQSCFYNAWEDDRSEDPLIGLTMSIMNAYGKEKKEVVKKVLRCLLIVVPSLVTSSLTHLIKNYLHVPIDIQDICNKVQKEWKDTPTEFIEKLQDKDKKIDTIFKETILELIRGDKSKDDEKGKKLVILIDELDRCKPDFALQVLERVKHFLNIQNVIFIFGIDKEQLQHMIKHHYGNIDSNKYLQRFFDFSFQLPYKDPDFFTALVKNYYHKRPKTNNQIAFHKSDQCKSATLLSCFDITARDVIRVCRDTDIVVSKLGYDLYNSMSHYDKEFTRVNYGGPSPQDINNETPLHTVVTGYNELIILCYVLQKCYADVFERITKAENWKSPDTVIEYYTNHFFSKISDKICTEFGQDLSSEIKIAATILIMCLYAIHFDIKKEKGATEQEKQKELLNDALELIDKNNMLKEQKDNVMKHFNFPTDGIFPENNFRYRQNIVVQCIDLYNKGVI